MTKEKLDTWCETLHQQRASIESIPNEEVGAGLKAALRYFDNEDVNDKDLSGQAYIAFCGVRQYILESVEKYYENEGAE